MVVTRNKLKDRFCYSVIFMLITKYSNADRMGRVNVVNRDKLTI